MRLRSVSMLIFTISSFLLATELRVLNLNAWLLDLRGDSSNSASARLVLLKHRLSELSPDIITFQEVWGESYRNEINQICQDIGLSHTGYDSHIPWFTPGIKLAAGAFAATMAASFLAYRLYPRRECRSFMGYLSSLGAGTVATATGGLGVALLVADQKITRNFGNGLLICSRYPIESQDSFNFDSWTAFEEFALYRSVVRANVQVPGAGTVQVYNTHLGPIGTDQATLSDRPSDVVNNGRQLQQLLQWVQETQDRTSPVILAGDFNINTYDFRGGAVVETMAEGYQRIVGQRWQDSYGELHGRPFPSPPESWTDGPFNAHAFLHEGVHRGSVHPNQILDYIFYQGSGRMRVMESRVVLRERYAALPDEAHPVYERMFGNQFPLVPEAERNALRERYGLTNLPFHVSDHFGVMTRFRISAD